MGLMVRAGLGLNPWNVLHQGLAPRLAWSFGAVTVLTGGIVLLAWWPLRQRPGGGTVANVVLIAVFGDLTLTFVPPGTTPPWQSVLLVSGIVLNSAATAIYVVARLGPARATV